MFKKLLLGLWVAGLLGLGSVAMVNAAEEFNAGINFGQGTKWGIRVMWWEASEGWDLIGVIKTFLNRLLGLLSLVALVLLLWGGFKMLTAAGDEGKFKEWFKVLKQAGIWLAVIWLSWFIVSIVFRVLWNSTTDPVTPA